VRAYQRRPRRQMSAVSWLARTVRPMPNQVAVLGELLPNDLRHDATAPVRATSSASGCIDASTAGTARPGRPAAAAGTQRLCGPRDRMLARGAAHVRAVAACERSPAPTVPCARTTRRSSPSHGARPPMPRHRAGTMPRITAATTPITTAMTLMSSAFWSRSQC
jgi:hypothetical protein